MNNEIDFLFGTRRITTTGSYIPLPRSILPTAVAVVSELVIRQQNIHSQKIGAYFNDDLYSDLILSVGDKRFKAHKFILAVQSEYFRTLLTNGMSESSKKEISIEESHVNLFEKLLRFVYSGEMKLDGTNEKVEMLLMANKYLFTELEKSIGKQLDAMLSTGYFCSIYSAAFHCSAPELLSKCFKFADSQPSEILKLEGISNLDELALNEIIRRESFKATQAELFEAISKWIAKWNEDKDPDVLLSNIRLEEMTPDFLLQTVRPSNIFSADRILDAISKRNPKKVGTGNSTQSPIQVMINIHRGACREVSYKINLTHLYSFETIAHVKDQISMHRNKNYRMIAYDKISLYYKGTLLQDDRTLKSYGIRTGKELKAQCSR